MKYFYLFLFLLSFQFLNAQDFKIEGEVKDSTSSEPLSYANVILKTPSDSIFRSDVTDDKGKFELTKIPSGNYTLSISFVGFNPYTQELKLEKDLDIGTIMLQESTTTLGELTIEGAAVEVIVKEDTLEYNAAAFKVPEGSELEELLKKMPGVEIKDGSLTINGKKIEKILVDGKPFFNANIATLLKELPADFVKQIQVIDQKSEEAEFTGHDDGKRTPVVNVVSKPDKKKGYFGSLRGTISPPGRYDASGSFSYLKGKNRYSLNGGWNNLNSANSFSIPMEISSADVSRLLMMQAGGASGIGSQQNLGGSYSVEVNEKLEISTSLRWSNNNSLSQTDISREYIQSSDEGRIYNEQSERERDNTNVTGSLSIRYEPSKNNQYSFSQSVSSASSLSTNWKKGETILNGGLLNSTDNRGYMENERLGLDTRFGWRHKFAKEGRTLSLSFSNSHNKTDGADSVKSENIFTDGPIQQQIFDQVSKPDNMAINRSFSVAVTEKIGENSSLKLGYQNQMEEDKSEQLLYDFDPQTQGYTDLDPVRSSQYVLKNKNNSLSLNYGFKIKKYSISPRLTYQNILIKNDQVYPRVVDTENSFSGLNTGFSIYGRSEKGKQLQMSFSRSMTVPRAEQLQDVLDNSNPLFLRQGNPDLKSGFSNNLMMYYMLYNEESKQYTSIQISARSSENATTNYTIVGDGTNSPNGLVLPVGARYSRPVNVSGGKSVNVNISSSKRILKDDIGINYGLSFDYAFNPQYLNEQLQSSETLGYSLGLGAASHFSEKLDLNLSFAPRYSTVSNSSPEEPSNNYFSWTGSFRGKWVIAEEFYITSNLVYSYNGGVGNLGSFDRLLWTASLGKKILNKKLDLNIMANDILRQASDQDRSISAEYIENSSTALLRQVFRISISYKFNKLG
ncbi:MAG: TonB-dependent receptor [Cytophagia bacterium]|nr:TonB-dependent receptor [Cytophagia bacterium]